MISRTRSSVKRTFLMYSLMLVLCVGQLALFPATGAAAGNLAQGKTISASSVGDVYAAVNANDGNQGSYWESASNAFPQWIKVDLGAGSSVNQVVLKLPAAWESRTQTLSVQGSTDDTSYSNLAASAGYVFNPSSGSNSVTIPFTATTARYIKINFTANTGWPAAQLSEIEVYGTTASPPGTYEAEAAALSGGAKTNTDHSGYTGAAFVDGYLTQGATTTFTVTAPAAGNYSAALRYANASGSTKTLSVYVNGVKIRQTQLANMPSWDNWSTQAEVVALAAGTNTIAYKYEASDSGNVNLDQLVLTASTAPTATVAPTPVPTIVPTVAPTPMPTTTPTVAPTPTSTPVPTPTATPVPTATPTTGPGVNLAIGKAVNASSSVFTFVPANANDGDVTTYWEGAGGIIRTR